MVFYSATIDLCEKPCGFGSLNLSLEQEKRLTALHKVKLVIKLSFIGFIFIIKRIYLY